MRIGISGAQGSFSEEAALAYTQKNAIKDAQYVYLVSVENVLTALEKGEIDIGIFPVENLIGGKVLETLDATKKHSFTEKEVFEIDIHQNLLVAHGVTRGEITEIVSHEQALKQCKSYLAQRWPETKLREYEDTAKAAEDLAAGKLSRTTAVIASRAAAKFYHLQILEESIQDLKRNFTTFIAASAKL